jgi:hypothetical protein
MPTVNTPPTRITCAATLSRSGRPIAVTVISDVIINPSSPTPALGPISAESNGRPFALVDTDLPLCRRLLQLRLSERQAEIMWANLVRLAQQATSTEHYERIENVRDRALQRRKDYEALGRVLTDFNAALVNRTVRAPNIFVGLDEESRNTQPEAFVADGFALLGKMAQAMNGLRGSFYESLLTEAGSLINMAYPAGLPRTTRLPNPSPSRRPGSD